MTGDTECASELKQQLEEDSHARKKRNGSNGARVDDGTRDGRVWWR